MVLRPGPPPPPRPDFSKTSSTEVATTRATEPSAGAQELQVTGMGGKLPPFAVGPVTAQRRPAGSAGQQGGAGSRTALTSSVTRGPSIVLSPFTPPPFYTVKGSWERAPSASMRRQPVSEGTRRLMHSAPEPHNADGQLLVDLAGALPPNLEGKQWYSELHKLKTKFDPRWHAGTRQDPKLKGSWTEVNISDPVQPTADMPSIPGAAGDPHAAATLARRGSARANPNRASNWDNGQLHAVLRERAAEAAAVPRSPEKIDPTLQALLVVDQEPSLTYRGYKRTEGRLQSRLITAEYMRDFYRKRDKTGQKKLKDAQEVGMIEFEDVGGDKLQQQWAEARIETLFRRAEDAWDEKYGPEMEERTAQWKAHEARASPREGLEASYAERRTTSRARSQKTLVQMMSRKDSAGVQATPADLRKVREMMYSSVNSNAKDLSAPEYLYYEDPSFGAFDTLVGEDSVTFTRFSDPVEEETAKSRLDRVVLRNRAITMSAGPAATEVSEFVGAQTGLGKKDTRQLVRDRIQQQVIPQMDPNIVKRHQGKQVELGGDLPVHSAHLSKGKTYIQRVKDFDDIFPVPKETQSNSPRRGQ